MVDGAQAVIFDFDGLLMDTESTNILSWRREWQRWDLALDEDRFFVAHGGDVTADRYRKLAATVGDSFDQSLSHRRRTADRDDLNARLPLQPGMDDWLNQAASAGLRAAVASSSDTGWVTQHLGRVDAVQRFDVIIGGEQVAHHKPAPDVYLLALKRLHLDAKHAVAVEDTPHGVDAAHAAGIRCIAIPNPYVDPERVAHADLVLFSATEATLIDAILQAIRTKP